MPTVDYLPVAVAAGANVDSQATFAGSAYQLQGFQVGIAQPTQINKIERQSSMIGAAVANLIANMLGVSVLDDGNIANLITNLTKAVRAAAATQPPVVVAFSTTPVFDASQGTTFEITLTGNVTSSTMVNLLPGMRLTFIIKEDGTGGHSFVAPTSLPLAVIDTAANKTNIQEFKVDAGSNVYYTTPMSDQ